MIDRTIYTLYLLARYRKLEDHYVISGGLVFLWVHLDLLALFKIYCVVRKASFVDLFFEFRLPIVCFIIVAFFLSKLYARTLIKRSKSKSLFLKRVELWKIWVFMWFSVGFFLLTMIFL